MSYWDTSCLIKLYTPEPDSATFHTHLATGGACVTCDEKKPKASLPLVRQRKSTMR